MTLANLLAIQRLLAFSATPEGVQRLLAAAARNLADAQIAQLSAENRFDTAYKCILQCAMLGLWAHTRQFLQTQFPDLLVDLKT